MQARGEGAALAAQYAACTGVWSVRAHACVHACMHACMKDCTHAYMHARALTRPPVCGPLRVLSSSKAHRAATAAAGGGRELLLFQNPHMRARSQHDPYGGSSRSGHTTAAAAAAAVCAQAMGSAALFQQPQDLGPLPEASVDLRATNSCREERNSCHADGLYNEPLLHAASNACISVQVKAMSLLSTHPTLDAVRGCCCRCCCLTFTASQCCSSCRHACCRSAIPSCSRLRACLPVGMPVAAAAPPAAPPPHADANPPPPTPATSLWAPHPAFSRQLDGAKGLE